MKCRDSDKDFDRDNEIFGIIKYRDTLVSGQLYKQLFKYGEN